MKVKNRGQLLVCLASMCFLDTHNNMASRKIPSCKWLPPFLSIAELSAPGSVFVEFSVFCTLLGLLQCVSRRLAALTVCRALLVSVCFNSVMSWLRWGTHFSKEIKTQLLRQPVC